MVTIHNLGYPRIGTQHELKLGQNTYWKGQSSRKKLSVAVSQIPKRHWADQPQLDRVHVAVQDVEWMKTSELLWGNPDFGVTALPWGKVIRSVERMALGVRTPRSAAASEWSKELL